MVNGDLMFASLEAKLFSSKMVLVFDWIATPPTLWMEFHLNFTQTEYRMQILNQSVLSLFLIYRDWFRGNHVT